MIKFFLAIFILMAGVGTQLRAASAQDFAVAEPEFGVLNSELRPLEAYLSLNPTMDMRQAQAQVPNLVAETSLPSAGLALAEGAPPFFGSFCWGGCFNLLGVGVVYYTTDGNKTEVKSALIGCLINSLLFGGGWAGFLSS